MHLCRGNCLSQVLPGTFIVSPDTEYSTPLSRPELGAVILSQPWPPPGRGGGQQGRRPQCGGAGLGVGARSPDLPLQLIPLWLADSRLRNPGLRAGAWFRVSQPHPGRTVGFFGTNCRSCWCLSSTWMSPRPHGRHHLKPPPCFFLLINYF